MQSNDIKKGTKTAVGLTCSITLCMSEADNGIDDLNLTFNPATYAGDIDTKYLISVDNDMNYKFK